MRNVDLNQPLVTVVLPAYNVESYLNECMDSVVGQTYRNLEIICVNDGSTDRSGNIIKDYAEKDDRIIVIEQENSGISAARNAGLDIANGKYITFLDTDDYYELNAIELMVSKSERFNADICLCEVQRFDNITRNKLPTNYIPRPFPNKEPFSWEDWSEQIFKNSVVVFNKLMKLEFLKNNNIRFPNANIYEDFEYGFMSLRLASKIVIVNKRLINYRRNRQGSLTFDPHDRFQEYLDVNINTWNKMMEMGLLEDDGLKKSFIHKVATGYSIFCQNFSNIEQFREWHESIFSGGSILYHYEPDKYRIPVVDALMVEDAETFLINEYHRYYELSQKNRQKAIDRYNEIQILKKKLKVAEERNKSLIKFIAYNIKRVLRPLVKREINKEEV